MIYTRYRLHSHNWTPLSNSLALNGGEFESSEFVTDLDGTYIVSLAFAPKNAALEECLVGDRLFKDDCKDIGSGLDLDWSLTRRDSNAELVMLDRQTYRPRAFGGAGFVETVLGTFDAQ